MPTSKSSTTTNSLLFQTILNHATWSTLHVASRYLQVYASPMTFDGQAILSSTMGFAAIFLVFWSLLMDWCENHGYGSVVEERLGKENDNHRNQISNRMEEMNASSSNADGGTKETRVTSREKLFYTLLFAFTATCRASLNIASGKFTYPYYITLIASLTPTIIAIADALFFHSPYPPLLWPTVIFSGLGGMIIAISQYQIDTPSLSSDAPETSNTSRIISLQDNLIGCTLQLFAALFSASCRLLMKHTEHILSPTHMVQTKNVSNCIFPLVYTLIHNPGGWLVFRYLVGKNLVAWGTISVGVFGLASTHQVRLVRMLGPGVYSSWVAVQVLGSMILSALLLGEGVKNWLEWVGIVIMIVTISVYSVETRKWMEGQKRDRIGHKNEKEEKDGRDDEKVYLRKGVVEDKKTGGDEELVLLHKARDEDSPLLAEKSARTNRDATMTTNTGSNAYGTRNALH